jgi:hypothetical protein
MFLGLLDPDPDPDPLVRGMDPWNRDSGSTPKCHGSATLLSIVQMREQKQHHWYTRVQDWIAILMFRVVEYRYCIPWQLVQVDTIQFAAKQLAASIVYNK